MPRDERHQQYSKAMRAKEILENSNDATGVNDYYVILKVIRYLCFIFSRVFSFETYNDNQYHVDVEPGRGKAYFLQRDLFLKH